LLEAFNRPAAQNEYTPARRRRNLELKNKTEILPPERRQGAPATRFDGQPAGFQGLSQIFPLLVIEACITPMLASGNRPEPADKPVPPTVQNKHNPYKLCSIPASPVTVTVESVG
jgi:hypothetical protein